MTTPDLPEPRPLVTELRQHGHSYERVFRTGNAAVFHVYMISGHSKRLIGYEVIRIRIKEQMVVPNGKVIPRRECYPSDEEFGRHGWYYSHGEYEAVLAKFKEIIEEEQGQIE